MKKYLTIVSVVLCLLLVLCACKSGNNEATNPVTEPSASDSEVVKPTENVTIDWETPIDVDDSFLEDPTEPGDTPVDPSDETGPLTTVDPSNPTDPSVEPTDAPQATDAPTSDPPEATEPAEQIPTKPSGSSGAIELPMIPG